MRFQANSSSESDQNSQLTEWVFQQGNFLMILQEIDRAIEAYSHAIELNSDNADAYNNRAVAYANKGDFDFCHKRP